MIQHESTELKPIKDKVKGVIASISSAVKGNKSEKIKSYAKAYESARLINNVLIFSHNLIK